MQTNPLITMHRTHDPKFTTWQGDGTGRDTYILNNDGGFHVPKDNKGLKPKSNYMKGFKIK